MRRLIVSKVLAVGLAASVWACSNTTPTTVTPNPNPVTDTFSGTLTVNGALTFTFVATTPGTITATLTTVSPDSTAPMGLSLGTWNGASCQANISNDNAAQGAAVTATATTTANLCVRVFDAKGTLPQSEAITLTVVHP